MSELAILYTLTASRHDALILARTLIVERLAACANLLDGVTSVYHWDGCVCESGEVLLLLKTRAELVEQAMHRIRSLHPYDCPCILSLAPTSVFPDYLQWANRETSAAIVQICAPSEVHSPGFPETNFPNVRSADPMSPDPATGDA
ncbi:MAG: divalent-cation tolerance protein CutA [Planctomycetaceae bacterium]